MIIGVRVVASSGQRRVHGLCSDGKQELAAEVWRARERVSAEPVEDASEERAEAAGA